MSTSALSRPSALPSMSRNTTIVVSVIALHVAVLWAMQTGLLRRVAEAVVPAEILVEIMAPPSPPTPQPKPQAQPKVQVKAPTPKPVAPTPTPAVAQQPAPTPLAIAPSANAPAPSAAAPTAVAAATASANTGSAANAPPTPAAPPKTIERSCVEANYVYNPKPPYPPVSRRLQEVGTTVVRVLVGTDGLAKKVELQETSSFDRLDKAAIDGVRSWRFLPCQVDGKPAETIFLIPLPFQLTR